MEFENSAEIGTVYMGEAVVGSSESDGQSRDKGGIMGRCLGCIAAQQIIGELQAENERLKAEVERFRRSDCECTELVQVREEVERLNVTIRKEMEMRRDAYVKIAALKAERDSITRHAMKMEAKFKTVNADLLAALDGWRKEYDARIEFARAEIAKVKEVQG